MDINFELYKVFYFVSKTLSFSDASEKLYISQSAVSQSIKTLEEKIGCQLFFRNTKRVKLTREGEMLFKHVEQAFNFLKSGERTLEEMHSLEQGDIKIGASDTICKYYLLPYLKSFNRLYPKIKIHITNRTSPKCIELLKNGSVDLSVINIPENLNVGNVHVTRTKSIHDIFVAGSGYAELSDRKVALKELENYPILVLHKNTTTRGFFDTLLDNNGVTVNPEVELSSISLLVDMAVIGLGIAYVPDESVQEELRSGKLFKLDIVEEVPERYLGIITHSNIPVSIAASKFIELLEQ